MMPFLKRWSLITIVILATLGAAAAPTLADCPDGTTGDDTINCTTSQPISDGIDAGIGDDTITIYAGVEVGQVGGDSVGTQNNGVGQSGDDTIINNGTTNNIIGDFSDSAVAGNDTIINNGTSANIYGDYSANFFATDGDDTIINNGTSLNIYGDYYGNAGGDDTITNNGTVNGDIVGEGSVSLNNNSDVGDDTITNNGTVNGSVNGEWGNDTIVNNGVITGSIGGDFGGDAPGNESDTITNNGVVGGNISGNAGDDTITLVVGSSVGGTVSGGSGTDTLIFSGTTTDQAGYDLVQAFLNCSPCSGTITLEGRTYTFDSFEALKSLLVLLIESGFTQVDINIAQRINSAEHGAPVALYCTPESITVVDIGADGQGVGELHFTLGALPPVASEPILLASAGGNQLLLQPDGTLRVVGPSLDGTKTYSLSFTTDCAPLGVGTES